MGCMSTCCRILMVLINMFSMIIGLGILASGVMLILADKFVEDDMSDLLDNTQGIGFGAGIVDSASTPEDKDKIIGDAFEVAQIVGIIFVVIGAVIFLMSLMGCIGGCCLAKCALITYAICAFIVLIAIAVLAGVFFSGIFNDDVKDEFKDRINEDFGGFDSFTPESLLLNYVMIEGKCCGIDSYLDFQNSTSWNKTRLVNSTGEQVETVLTTPVACCKMDGDFPDVTPMSDQCATSPTVNISNYQNGCWEQISEDLEDYRIIGIVVCVAIIVFFFILGVMAIFLFTQTVRE